jgi:hypothetical protein
MATSSDVTLYNDLTLWSAECLLEDIHERAPDWDQRPDGERADLSYEWEGTVGRLHGAVQDDREGLLTPEQQQRLRTLARRIVESRGVIHRIGFDYPDLGHVLNDVPLTAAERIEHDIWTLHSEAGRLRALGELGDSPFVSARERQAFPSEWQSAVDLFERIAGLAVRGELTPMARAELRNVAEGLAELLPTMQRLHLKQPDPEALARARSVEAA